MANLKLRSIRLFRFAGIDVVLHWSWFLVAWYEIGARSKHYHSLGWSALEYMGLFLIVFAHECGHAFACRQVGGRADRIVLWPLGGIAFVRPPLRPGAMLWSLVGGPLVNVATSVSLFVVLMAAIAFGWKSTLPSLYTLVLSLTAYSVVLLIFNLLPVYPLDGGQILQSLLWFVIGRAKSLMVSVVVGFIGVAGILLFAIRGRHAWIAVLDAFILFCCWSGLAQAITLLRIAKASRREGLACPVCKAAPPIGEYWRCGTCRARFDQFQRQGECPHCGKRFPTLLCLEALLSGHLPIGVFRLWRPVTPWLGDAGAREVRIAGRITRMRL